MKKIFSIGRIKVEPGQIVKGFLPTANLDMPDGTGNFWPIPVIVINGSNDGPVFEVDGAIHADEQMGTLTVLELAKRLDPNKINGAFIGVPVLNSKAFLSKQRYYQNVNMNRVFPGDPYGSATHRAVHTFWNEIMMKSDYTINLHGTSQVQVPRVVFSEHTPDMSEKTLEMAKAVAYDPKWIIASKSEHTRLEHRTVNWACAQVSKPNVFLEYGPRSYMPEDIVDPLETSINGIFNCMKWAGVLDGRPITPKYWRMTSYYTNVRSSCSGIRYDQPCLKLNNMVNDRETLSVITDFLGNEIEKVLSPYDGIVLMLPQDRAHTEIDEEITIVGKTPTIIKA